MSWSIIKKAVNSNLNIPLNVRQDAQTLCDFTRNESVDFVFRTSENVGLSMALAFNLDMEALKTLRTMNAIAASTTAMNIVAASTTAMNIVAASTTAMNIVAASTAAMNIVIASTTAMNIVIASTTAMNAVAASTTAMNSVFDSSVARNAMWDSASASGILMTTGRAWMVANRQLEFTRGSLDTWVSANIPGKIFVLGRHTSDRFGTASDDGNYRTLATGGDVGTFRTSGVWQDRSDRINNLEVWKLFSNADATISLRYVLM